MSSARDLSSFETGQLFLFTSLTAGSSHIITATSRLETILKANKIPFQAVDLSTDEQAKRLWQRRAQQKKLPGLVKDGYVIGDLEQVEEWNEFGELRENIGDVLAAPPAGGGRQGINIRPMPSGSPREHDDAQIEAPHPSASPTAFALMHESSRIALPGAAEIAARNKSKSPPLGSANSPPTAIDAIASPPPAKQEEDSNAAKEAAKSHPALDHLSSPASRIQSGTATPETEPVKESPPAEGGEIPAATQTHRGSEVQVAPLNEIKRLESESTLHEDPSEEDAVEKTTKAMESVTFQEPDKPQDQHPKEADDTSESVED